MDQEGAKVLRKSLLSPPQKVGNAGVFANKNTYPDLEPVVVRLNVGVRDTF
jgi:hypothetical protein